jgi:hypothetical protein
MLYKNVRLPKTQVACPTYFSVRSFGYSGQSPAFSKNLHLFEECPFPCPAVGSFVTFSGRVLPDE